MKSKAQPTTWYTVVRGDILSVTVTRFTDRTVWLKTPYGEHRNKRDGYFPTEDEAIAHLIAQAQKRVNTFQFNTLRQKELLQGAKKALAERCERHGRVPEPAPFDVEQLPTGLLKYLRLALPDEKIAQMTANDLFDFAASNFSFSSVHGSSIRGLIAQIEQATGQVVTGDD